MADENIKISLFPQAPLVETADGAHRRVRWFSYILTTAQVSYGTKYANENFKLSLDALREDFSGYCGVENIRPAWTDMVGIWRGHWYAETEDGMVDKKDSYVYEWTDEWKDYPDYIANKFRRDGIYFILDDAPMPCTEPVADPHPETMKVVSKKYIDDWQNGHLRVPCEIVSQICTVPLRPYTCHYEVPLGSVVKVDFTTGSLTEWNGKTRLHFFLTFLNLSGVTPSLEVLVDGRVGRFVENNPGTLANRIRMSLGSHGKGLDMEFTAYTGEDGQVLVSPAADFFMSAVELSPLSEEITSREYELNPAHAETDASGNRVLTATVREERKPYRLVSEGTAIALRGGEKTVESDSFEIFHIPFGQPRLTTVEFTPAMESFRDSGEHNNMTVFRYGGERTETATGLGLTGNDLTLEVAGGSPVRSVSREFLRVVDNDFREERDRLTFVEQGSARFLNIEHLYRDGHFGVVEDEGGTKACRTVTYGVDECWHTAAATDVIDLTQVAGKELVFVRDGENEEMVRYDLVSHLHQTIYLDLPKYYPESSAAIRVSLNCRDLSEDREYTWRFYVKGSPDRERLLSFQAWKPGEGEDDPAIQVPVKWADGTEYDGQRVAAGKLYCFEFTKLPEDIFIGRELYRVSS